MRSAAIATMLCYIMAMGMALPSEVAVSEDLKAETQWHLRAPALGCVVIYHYAGGSAFRSYACDDPEGEVYMLNLKHLKSRISNRLFYDHAVPIEFLFQVPVFTHRQFPNALQQLFMQNQICRG